MVTTVCNPIKLKMSLRKTLYPCLYEHWSNRPIYGRWIIKVVYALIILGFVYCLRSMLRDQIENYSNSLSEEVKASNLLDRGKMLNRSIVYQIPSWTYLINEVDFCSRGRKPYIISILPVTAADTEKRNLIRKLWGNDKLRHQIAFGTVFFTGMVADDIVMANLRKESDMYRDILLVDIVDSYQNLTIKSLSILHWADKFCSDARWLLKIDTDVIINPFKLTRYVKNRSQSSDMSTTFICSVFKDKKPCFKDRKACRNFKWGISHDEYHRRLFPDYCMGGAYLVPRKIIGPIYDGHKYTPFFRFEDVYITGMIPKEINLGMQKHDISHLLPVYCKMTRKDFKSEYLMIVDNHSNLKTPDILYLWNRILQDERLTHDYKVYLSKGNMTN